MKYKCDNCEKVFKEGEEIIAINNNVGGLSLMENTLSKKWVILCNDCYCQTDIKYFWHIKELQELLEGEKK